MSRIKCPITGEFVRNRMVFFIFSDWEYDYSESGDIPYIESYSNPAYVGYGGMEIDELYAATESTREYDSDLSVIRIPQDYNRRLKLVEEGVEVHFFVPDDSDMPMAFTINLEEFSDYGFQVFALSEDEKENLNADNITTEKAETLLKNKLDGFNIS